MVDNKDKNETGNKDEMPAIDFATFIFSLASSAQVHLGQVANPATGKVEKNLSLAKQTIDILDILKKKSEGNRTEEETKLFDAFLFNLKMVYVELSKEKK